MIYFFLAAAVLWGLLNFAKPDNSPYARMNRLLERLPNYNPDLRHDDGWNERSVVLDPVLHRMAIGRLGRPIQFIPFWDITGAEVQRGSKDQLALAVMLTDINNPVLEMLFANGEQKIKPPFQTPKVPAERRLTEWQARFQAILRIDYSSVRPA